MSDPADTPAADPSSVKQSSAHAKQVIDGFTEPRFAVGDLVPHRELWTLERKLGTGGFGEVWLAKHEYRDERVAVKFCTHRKLAEHEKRMIVRAMKHAGDHPNVVPLLDCNLRGDIPSLLYEYVPGGTLADAVKELWRTYSTRDRLFNTIRVLYPIACALALFHCLEEPIVHRDLKPTNILMSRGVPRLTDFGIGCVAWPLDATGTHQVPTAVAHGLTLLYCSPERHRGLTDGHPPAPHPQDDVFALGVIAYQLLRGDLLARPGTDAARHLRAMDVPAALVDLITDSVSEEPSFRPTDAGQWERVLGERLPPSAARAAAPVAPTGPAVRRISVSVPGRWSARAVGTEAAWNPVTETPGVVYLAPNADYSFRPAVRIIDEELAGLRVLDGAPAFRALDLSWCEHLTDAGLAHLTTLGQLHDLDLSGCSQLTDAGLAHLTALRALRHLDISCCGQITDTGLARLTALGQLRSLALLVCERLTDAGVAAFKNAVPGCEVRG